MVGTRIGGEVKMDDKWKQGRQSWGFGDRDPPRFWAEGFLGRVAGVVDGS